MELNELYARINEKAAEATKQQAEITQKLEANKNAKKQAEESKRVALEAKDEAAYKKACRELADAEAGIEFNTICLREFQRKPNATEKESEEILRAFRNAAAEIHLSAMLKIEKALKGIMEIAEPAVNEFSTMDEMARTWKRSVMKDNNEKSLSINITREFNISIKQFINLVKPHLYDFKIMHEKNTLLNGGGKK